MLPQKDDRITVQHPGSTKSVEGVVTDCGTKGGRAVVFYTTADGVEEWCHLNAIKLVNERPTPVDWWFD